jgi:L-2-hydroxyglutarate oxidase LhgO
MDPCRTDLVIIGAGIVGLATAMKLLEEFPGLNTIVLEKEAEIAKHQTGHNSGVIHSGIYYRPGSLKAQLCVSGAAELVSFCRDNNVPYDICGKLIVATEEAQLQGLKELQRRAAQNGILGVKWVKAEEISDYEPHVVGLAALHVPTTGILDYRLVAQKYADIVKKRSGEIRTGAMVLGIKDLGERFLIETSGGNFETKFIINCAGLYSDKIAHLAGVEPGLRIIPFRGEYYELKPEKRYLIRALVYPVPDPRFPFLGVHFTRQINGGVEAGPNAVLAFRREGYRKFDINAEELMDTVSFRGFWRMSGKFWRTGLKEMWRSVSQRSFASALRQLVPEVQDSDLASAGAGVRAQAVDENGVLLDDFHFVKSPRALHVCNVPSPAATASLAIASEIREMAVDHFGLRNSTVAAMKDEENIATTHRP